MNRILLAVDDSPAGLSAARAAVRIASLLRADLRAITVLPPTVTSTDPAIEEVAEREAASLLAFVDDLAHADGVHVETEVLHGQVARMILGQAALGAFDLIVLGRAGQQHVGERYIGSDVKHVLEFSEVPVLVVPSR